MKTRWGYDLTTDKTIRIAARLVAAARQLPEDDNESWSVLLRSVAEFESQRGEAATYALSWCGWHDLIGV